MSKSYEVQGLVHSIGATTEYGSNGFTKREFVIKLTGEDENSNYPNYAALELVRDKCELMDQYQVGDEIKAHFNLSGRLWSKNGGPEKCFTSLQAWRIEGVSAAEPFDQGSAPEAPEEAGDPGWADDDIPF